MKPKDELHCHTCAARAISAFCTLKDEEQDEVDTAKECGHYKKNQVIFSEGGRSRGLFCVNSGKVKLVQTGSEGKEQILHLAKEGDVMGYRALLSGDAFSCSAVALEDSNICFVPRSTIVELIAKNHEFSLRIIQLLAHELKVAERSITDLAQKPVRERVAEAILLLKETYGVADDGTINVRLTREELANIVGTATESAIRLLSEFKSDGIIELEGRNIRILNLQALVRTAHLYD